MKIEVFNSELRREVESICKKRNWSVDNAKERGMAFENWCFELFDHYYNETENDESQCILRNNDFNLDVIFPSTEHSEVFYMQCKYKKHASQ